METEKQVDLKIGERLKQIRINRNLSLDDTAELTSVSKPMLGQIERGQSVPTITTLWKIASGLKVPLSSFLADTQTEYTISDFADKSPIIEENGMMRAYTLFPYDPIRNVETFMIEFDSGCYHSSEKHNDGVEEYILIVEGNLQMILNDNAVTVSQGQALRFRADIPHCYNNISDKKCTIYNVIFYPKP